MSGELYWRCHSSKATLHTCPTHFLRRNSRLCHANGSSTVLPSRLACIKELQARQRSHEAQQIPRRLGLPTILGAINEAKVRRFSGGGPPREGPMITTVSPETTSLTVPRSHPVAIATDKRRLWVVKSYKGSTRAFSSDTRQISAIMPGVIHGTATEPASEPKSQVLNARFTSQSMSLKTAFTTHCVTAVCIMDDTTAVKWLLSDFLRCLFTQSSLEACPSAQVTPKLSNL